MARMEIGVLVPLTGDMHRELKKVRDLGLRCCQVVSWEPDRWTGEAAAETRAAAAELEVRLTAFWSGWTGPKAWDFRDGPRQVGLVPPAHRARRVEELRQGASFAAHLGVPAIVTHVGFIPEDPNDPNFAGTVDACRAVAECCAERELEFWFETGQETPVTLLRTIQAMDMGNVGVNLDAGNLVLYGRGNPVDSLDVYGDYVRGVHAKDGFYPTDPYALGREVPLGRGKVDWASLIVGLQNVGYGGTLTIEREITGAQQVQDIRDAIRYLRPLLAET